MAEELDPRKDYRYVFGGVELEAYQITDQTRWVNQDWPEWLKMQRLTDETNVLFAKQESPEQLWLALPTGDVALPDLAWLVKHEDGRLAIVDALDFEEAAKVVPIPPKVVTPAADGMPDESHLFDVYPQHVPEGKTAEDYKRPPAGAAPAQPVATAENIAGDVTEMRNEMMSAIRLLQEAGSDGEPDLHGKALEALDYLIYAMSRRTKWCNCPPGVCSQEDEAGCRINSPLVKAGG